MLELLYNALKTDVNEKIDLAHNISKNKYDTILYPAAIALINCIHPYNDYILQLPTAINKKLKELYYFDK
jgi:hypothetical protein